LNPEAPSTAISAASPVLALDQVNISARALSAIHDAFEQAKNCKKEFQQKNNGQDPYQKVVTSEN
jgi:hypothetical protein